MLPCTRSPLRLLRRGTGRPASATAPSHAPTQAKHHLPPAPPTYLTTHLLTGPPTHRTITGSLHSLPAASVRHTPSPPPPGCRPPRSRRQTPRAPRAHPAAQHVHGAGRCDAAWHRAAALGAARSCGRRMVGWQGRPQGAATAAHLALHLAPPAIHATCAGNQQQATHAADYVHVRAAAVRQRRQVGSRRGLPHALQVPGLPGLLRPSAAAGGARCCVSQICSRHC